MHDWDSTHTPILFDDTIAGQPRKLVAVANRNGFFYVLDRVTGAYLLGRPYTQGDVGERSGRQRTPRRAARTPIPPPKATASARAAPAARTGTRRPTVPRTHLVYFFSNEQCDTFMSDEQLEPPYRPGRPFIGSAFFALPDERIETAVRAVDPKTGTVKWVFKQYADAWAGVLSTAGGLVFSGDGQGNFIALDAETGKDLWHIPLGASIQTAAISFAVDGRQYVTIVAGDAVFAFALRGSPDRGMTGTAVSFSALDWTIVALYFVANTAICVWCALHEGKGHRRLLPREPQRRLVPDRLLDLRVQHRRRASDRPRRLRRGLGHGLRALGAALLAGAGARLGLRAVLPAREDLHDAGVPRAALHARRRARSCP